MDLVTSLSQPVTDRTHGVGLEPGSPCRSEGQGSLWLHVWGCQTRSVSSEHTAIPFPSWMGGSGLAALRDQSTAQKEGVGERGGGVSASQVSLSNYKRSSNHQPD